MNKITATEFITERKSKIKNGLRIKMKDIGRQTERVFKIEDSAFLICKHLDANKEPFKIFIFERIKAEKPDGKWRSTLGKMKVQNIQISNTDLAIILLARTAIKMAGGLGGNFVQ